MFSQNELLKISYRILLYIGRYTEMFELVSTLTASQFILGL